MITLNSSSRISHLTFRSPCLDWVFDAAQQYVFDEFEEKILPKYFQSTQAQHYFRQLVERGRAEQEQTSLEANKKLFPLSIKLQNVQVCGPENFYSYEVSVGFVYVLVPGHTGYLKSGVCVRVVVPERYDTDMC